MTRWARGATSQKKEHDGTPWNTLKAGQLKQNKNEIPKRKEGEKDRKEKSKDKIKQHEIDNVPVVNEISSGSDLQNGLLFKDTTDKAVGIALELEKLGARQGMEEQTDIVCIVSSKKNPSKLKKHKLRKCEKKIIRKGEEMLKTDLTEKLSSIKKSTPLSSEETKEVNKLIHNDQRREKRRIKRIDLTASEKTCFNCRKTGHTFADCPQGGHEDTVSGICFKCGSTEHTILKCKLRLPEGKFPFAKCFVCGEQGHMSKQCPDNPRGLYPKGGCCRTCGSVEHYNKDCLELQQQQGIENYTLGRISTSTNRSVDEEIFEESLEIKPLKKKPKIVKF